MRDSLGREIEYLRISITQHCNLKCIYCVPEDQEIRDKQCHNLTSAELETIVREMAKLGIKKVRLTGGEPLIRSDICDIVYKISKIPGIEDLSMTTNGMNLGVLAEKLKAAGLMRVNISLDSLKSQRLARITGAGNLEKVMYGIEKALEVGLNPVKINTVLIKGINDDEIDDFIGFAKDKPVEVRFIELMPMSEFGENNRDKIIYNSSIAASHPEMRICDDNRKCEPSRYYRIDGFKGRIGLISPMSHKFCGGCNRIRLTCDGKIKPCLGDNGELDIADIMKNSPDRLGEHIKNVIYKKPSGHCFEDNFSSNRSMKMIGG